VAVPLRGGVLGRDFLPHLGLTVCLNRNATRKQNKLRQAPWNFQESIRCQTLKARLTGIPPDTNWEHWRTATQTSSKEQLV
jgi:hypothetical protein